MGAITHGGNGMPDNQDFSKHIDLFVRIALIIGIVAWAFQLLHPLLGVLAWGFILAVIFYPIHVWLSARLGGRSTIAASCITLLMLFFVIGLTVFITNDIAKSVSELTSRMNAGEFILPKPPEALQSLPLVGDKFHETWMSASINLKTEMQKYSGTVLEATKYVFGKLADTGKNLLLFIVSIIFSGFLLVHASGFMDITNKFVDRVAHAHGTDMVKLVKETIQNVSRGVLGIALLQTFIFAVLLYIASVPGIGILSLIALLLSIVQVGLIFLALPIIAWLFFTKSIMLAAIISILLIFDSLMDSFLKPIVLARGLSTPTIIIFLGLIGGIIVYGFIGIFVGPVVIAIAYDLLCQWIGVEVGG